MPAFQGKKWTTERILAKLAGKRITSIQLWNTAADDELLVALAAQRRLKSAAIDSSIVSDVGVRQLIQKCPLESLHLWNAGRVTDRLVSEIDSCTTLCELCLDGVSATDAGIADVGKLPNLWALDVGNTSITDVGVESIASTTISLVSLDNCSIRGHGFASWRQTDKMNLYAAGSRLNDDGFAVICRTFPFLWGLIVSNTHLTDDGLRRLKGQRTSFIELCGTPVTRAGVLWLIDTVPLQALEVDPNQMSAEEALNYKDHRGDYFRIRVRPFE